MSIKTSTGSRIMFKPGVQKQLSKEGFLKQKPDGTCELLPMSTEEREQVLQAATLNTTRKR